MGARSIYVLRKDLHDNLAFDENFAFRLAVENIPKSMILIATKFMGVDILHVYLRMLHQADGEY